MHRISRDIRSLVVAEFVVQDTDNDHTENLKEANEDTEGGDVGEISHDSLSYHSRTTLKRKGKKQRSDPSQSENLSRSSEFFFSIFFYEARWSDESRGASESTTSAYDKDSTKELMVCTEHTHTPQVTPPCALYLTRETKTRTHIAREYDPHWHESSRDCSYHTERHVFASREEFFRWSKAPQWDKVL